MSDWRLTKRALALSAVLFGTLMADVFVVRILCQQAPGICDTAAAEMVLRVRLAWSGLITVPAWLVGLLLESTVNVGLPSHYAVPLGAVLWGVFLAAAWTGLERWRGSPTDWQPQGSGPP